MRIDLRAVALGLAAVLLAAACGGSDASGGNADSSPTTGAPVAILESELESPSETAIDDSGSSDAPVDDAGDAVSETPDALGVHAMCVGTRIGLSCLTESGWANYDTTNSPIYDWVRSLAICPDGTVIVPTLDGIALLQEGRWSEIEIDFVSGVVDALACTNTGEIWVGGYEALGYFSGGEWTTFVPGDVLGNSEFVNSVDDIEPAPDGSVWVLTANSVSTYNNGAWTVWEEGAGIDGSFFPGSLAIDNLGGGAFDVYVSDGFDGIGRLVDGGWTFKDLSLIGDDAMAVQGGAVFVSSYEEGIIQLIDGISTAITPEFGLSSDTVYAIEVDRSGRQWVGTNYGLTLLAADETRILRVDNSGLLDNDIYAVATLGNGPTVPPEETKVAGALSGRILDTAGTPLAGITVEICVEELRDEFDGETPCSDHPYSVTGTTGSDGSFELGGARPGRYVIAMNPPSGWTYLVNDFGGAARFSVTAGEVSDIGPIELS